MKNKILSILFLVNILSEQVSHSQQVQFNYDNNQKLKQALSSQNDKKFSYDPNGNRISHYQIGEVTTYIFNGNGAWSDTANWLNGHVPPRILPVGGLIIIDPVMSGECVLNVNQKITLGANLKVAANKRFRIPGDVTSED